MKFDRSAEALISCNALLERVTDWISAIVCFKKEKKLIIHTRVAGNISLRLKPVTQGEGIARWRR